MTETASLIIKVDSRGAKSASADLDKLTQAGSKSERAAHGVGKAWGVAIGVISSAAIIGATTAFVRMADASANMSARLRLATRSQEEFNVAHKATFDIAQRTSTELSSVVDLYAKLSQSTGELGVSQGDLLQLTEAITQTFQISGATAQEAAGGLRQLSQAMAGGVLRAEEFNSIIESSPRLVKALADGMGIEFGRVRQYVNEGKISSEQLVQALLSQSEAIQAEFDQMPLTVGRAIQEVRNALTRLVGDADEAEGASKGLAEAIRSVAEALNDPGVKEGFTAMVSGIASVTAEVVKGAGLIANYIKQWRELSALRGGGSPDDASMDGLNARLADINAQRRAVRDGKPTSANGFGVADDEAVLARLDREARQIQREITARIRDEQYGAAFAGTPKEMDFTRGAPGGASGGGSVSDDIQKQVDKIREQAEAYGLSRAQLAELNRERALSAATNDAERAAINAAYDALVGRIKADEGATAAKKSRAEADKAWLEQEREILAHDEIANAARMEYTNAQLQRMAEEEEAVERKRQATADLISDLQFELSIIGLSNVEREKAIALRYADVEATSAEGQAISDLIDKLDKAREARSLQDEMQDSARSLFATITTDSQRASQALDRFFDNLKRRLAEKTFDALIAGFSGMAVGGGWAGFASGFASSFTGGGKASGGPLMAGQGYIVGDGGKPELFVPGESGRLVPLGQGGGGGGNKMTVNIHNAPAGTETRQSTAPDGGLQLDVLIGGVVKAVAGDIAGGGAAAQAIQGRYGLRPAV